MNVEEAKVMFIAQGRASPFGLWEIAKVVKEDMGIQDPSEVIEKSLEIVRSLLKSGLRAGESLYVSGNGFVPWPEENIESIVVHIKYEWEKFGKEPNILDSPWFGSTSAVR